MVRAGSSSSSSGGGGGGGRGIGGGGSAGGGLGCVGGSGRSARSGSIGNSGGGAVGAGSSCGRRGRSRQRARRRVSGSSLAERLSCPRQAADRMSPSIRNLDCFSPMLCHCKVACTNSTISLMFGCKVGLGLGVGIWEGQFAGSSAV